MLGKQPRRFLSQLQGEVAKPMSSAEKVVAGELALSLHPTDHSVGTTYECQASLDPKIIGLRTGLKHPTQFFAFWRAALS